VTAAGLADELAIARRVVAEAAALVRGARPASIETKSNPRDLVTEWDHRVEERIRTRLAELSPGVPILGEEGGGAADGDRWLVDPIDGTVNFAHGLPLWAITVALERGGEPVVGVVDAPALGWTMWAARGGGAWTGDGERLAVSRIARLDQAMLASGFPYDRAETRHNFAEWEALQCKAGACRRLGAASLDLALVARGQLDGYWESRLEPWDVAAGALLVAEAGGRVTGLTGGRFAAAEGAAVATNGAIHEELLAALREVGGIVHHAPR
jgi:myo-inositol-1(or 4)-monophosphatase